MNADSSECGDRDECADHSADCDPRAICTNTLGSFSCTCPAPAYTGDGKQCSCSDGFELSRGGNCLGGDGQVCNTDAECVNRHCISGICCAQDCSEPGECHTSDGATCADGKQCNYPTAADGTSCDDAKSCTATSSCQQGSCVSGDAQSCDDHNPCTDDSCEEPIGCMNKNNENPCDDHDPCTQHDMCQVGTCQGSPIDCSAQTDACNVGMCDPSSGACKKIARADGTPCDDANSCTTSDTCRAGRCVGSGNACGQNATGCTPGSPNSCSCASAYTSRDGVCTLDDTACSDCSQNAFCTRSGSGVTCTCLPGYSGDGKSCSAIDPCKDNPCGAGRGSCVAGALGSHSCTCNAGHVQLGGTCVCDLSGAFAVRTRLDVTWDTTEQLEGGSDTSYSYALERHSLDSQGNLMIELQACGDIQPDLCGLGVAPILAAESYAQFVPVQSWDQPSMPRVRTQISLDKPLPGSAFSTPNVVQLLGISLSDPAGAWPQSHKDIAGTPDFDGSAVNGALWLDHDGDAVVGITSWAVPPGGIRADGVAPDPIKTYGPFSPSCPRGGGTHTPYAYWPGPPDALTPPVVRVARFYMASRTISAYQGSIVSCDEISGAIAGPDSGKIQVDARVAGCIRSLGASETACPSDVVDFLDSGYVNHKVTNAVFDMKRLPSSAAVSCASVRSMNFD